MRYHFFLDLIISSEPLSEETSDVREETCRKSCDGGMHPCLCMGALALQAGPILIKYPFSLGEVFCRAFLPGASPVCCGCTRYSTQYEMDTICWRLSMASNREGDWMVSLMVLLTARDDILAINWEGDWMLFKVRAILVSWRLKLKL